MASFLYVEDGDSAYLLARRPGRGGHDVVVAGDGEKGDRDGAFRLAALDPGGKAEVERVECLTSP